MEEKQKDDRGCMYLHVYSEPKASPRPRRSKHGGVYVPPTADTWKKEIIHTLQTEYKNRKALYPPYELDCTFRFPVAKGRKNNQLHTAKPDIDNVLKSTMDAITESGVVWKDDAEVAMLSARKIYSDSEPLASFIIIVGNTKENEESND